MKKSFILLKNERGHMLIFVMITAAITLVIFTSAVKIYTKSITETNFILNQIEVETIHQMSQSDLLKIKQSGDELQSNYHFVYPNGEIFLKLIRRANNKYLFDQDIVLNNNSAYNNTFEMIVE